MPESHDPLDRLAALGGGDPLPLASAEAVRARGEQRRRNGRTAVGLTGAAVLLAAGAAFGLGGAGDTPDSLGPAKPPTSAPTAAPSETASTEPTAVPTPTGSAAPAEQLLTPADAAAVRAGTWTERRSTLDDRARLDPCGGTTYPLDAKRTAVAARTLVHSDGQVLRQQVARYDTEASAIEAVTGYRRAVDGCRQRDLDEPAATPAFVRVHDVDSEPGRARFGADALFVASGTACGIEQRCDQQATRYSVVRRGASLVVLELAAQERSSLKTADAHALGDQLAEATYLALERISCEGGDCPRAPYAASPLPRTAQLTHGGEVWAVFLAVSEQRGAPALAAADARARAAGYVSTLASPYDCDAGSKEGLGYSQETELHASLLYFDSAATAQRFVDAYDGTVVKTVKVQTLCLD